MEPTSRSRVYCCPSAGDFARRQGIAEFLDKMLRHTIAQFPNARTIDVYLEDGFSDGPYLVFAVDDPPRTESREMKSYIRWIRTRSETCPVQLHKFFHMTTEAWGEPER
jgi:hypothetical protein